MYLKSILMWNIIDNNDNNRNMFSATTLVSGQFYSKL